MKNNYKTIMLDTPYNTTRAISSMQKQVLRKLRKMNYQ